MKLIIFDLDGVLMDSREMHYESLNKALSSIGKDVGVGDKWVISREEHLARFDGLSTKVKLGILSIERELPIELHKRIWECKQGHTISLISKLQPSMKLIEIMEDIWARNIRIVCASNSIRSTIETALTQLGIRPYFNNIYSNEDVTRPKPNPEMYMKAMIDFGVSPKDTLIIEDSHIGREGALASGGNLMPVENPDDLSLEGIIQAIHDLQGKKANIPWRSKKLNVVIPMAGMGSRFSQMGFTFPKPLIDVRGKPMIQVVKENLNIEANFIFIVQKEHYEKYNLQYLLQLIAPGCKIVQTEGVTEGAACTVLLARQFIDNKDPLLIANSDQFVEWNSNEAMYAFSADNIDAGILTFESTHPKYSFVKLDDNGFVTEVAEKKVISNHATVGIYYWKYGRDFVNCASKMINENKRVNNEFYVAPVFNEAIEIGLKIKVKKAEKMWSLGTPEDLNLFLTEHK